jgi:Fe-S-cluster-containing hydrogenase component 2
MSVSNQPLFGVVRIIAFHDVASVQGGESISLPESPVQCPDRPCLCLCPGQTKLI